MKKLANTEVSCRNPVLVGGRSARMKRMHQRSPYSRMFLSWEKRRRVQSTVALKASSLPIASVRPTAAPLWMSSSLRDLNVYRVATPNVRNEKVKRQHFVGRTLQGRSLNTTAISSVFALLGSKRNFAISPSFTYPTIAAIEFPDLTI